MKTPAIVARCLKAFSVVALFAAIAITTAALTAQDVPQAAPTPQKTALETCQDEHRTLRAALEVWQERALRAEAALTTNAIAKKRADLDAREQPSAPAQPK